MAAHVTRNLVGYCYYGTLVFLLVLGLVLHA